jgi:hypothetical protein
MHISFEQIMTVTAGIMGLYAFYPYIRDILRGKTRPHVFSWMIWALLMLIALFAQISEGAGQAAIVTGIFALLNLVVVALALRHGERAITRSDWVMLVAALLAIPLWLATKDPTWSVILICAIDVVAFVPTFRKSWGKPREETLQTYVLCGASFALSLLVVEAVNLSTVLYPLTLMTTNAVFVLMVFLRRRRSQ